MGGIKHNHREQSKISAIERYKLLEPFKREQGLKIWKIQAVIEVEVEDMGKRGRKEIWMTLNMGLVVSLFQ